MFWAICTQGHFLSVDIWGKTKCLLISPFPISQRVLQRYPDTPYMSQPTIYHLSLKDKTLPALGHISQPGIWPASP